MNDTIRRARAEDLNAIVAMLADGQLKARYEQLGAASYFTAFAAIDRDPNQLLVVADSAGEVVGTIQLSFILGLSHAGATRANLEGLQVRQDRRRNGLGTRLLQWS